MYLLGVYTYAHVYLLNGASLYCTHIHTCAVVLSQTHYPAESHQDSLAEEGSWAFSKVSFCSVASSALVGVKMSIERGGLLGIM